MRFHVYRSRGGSRRYPLLLDIQSSLIQGLPTRVVVPLRPSGDLAARIAALHPIFRIDGTDYVMATHELASIPANAIGAEVTSLEHQADAIVRALDFLFEGY